MYMANARKKQMIFVRFLVFVDKRKLTERLVSKGSDMTESGHPIGMFLSKAAKIETLIINLNLHFVI